MIHIRKVYYIKNISITMKIFFHLLTFHEARVISRGRGKFSEQSGVDFINVIHSASTDLESAKKVQLSHQYLFMILGSVHVKAVCIMLMKLSPGVDFINVLRTAFTQVDPEKTVKSTVSFSAFGIYNCKSCT